MFSATSPTMAPLTQTVPLRSSTPTPTPPPQQVVLNAYYRFWDTYAQAVLNLDPSLVESVASGERLEGIREEIEDLRQRGLAIRVSVTHSPVVIEVNEGSATIYDEVVNNSFYVNAQTKEPGVASGTGTMLQDTYVLQRTSNGTWKVVTGGRQR